MDKLILNPTDTSAAMTESGWIPPTAPVGAIDRNRLDHLYGRSAGSLLRVLAPSGYGKTFLAARWVASESREVRWVDLRRRHDDPVALFGAIRDAFDGIVEISNPTTAHAGSASPYLRALEDGLATARAAAPFVLVLDDVHRVRSSAANSMIATVVDHLPQHSTVLLVGRGHHDHGAVGRFRLAPGVVDVVVGDLAFDDSECHQMLASMGVDSGAGEVVDMLNTLEGWPAGVRLAGEVLRSGIPSDDIIDHVNLVDYLRGEWVGQLETAELDFLREVACLAQFTGEMCDEVLRRTGSAAILQRLHRDRVVVFAFDQRAGWYRLHRLLVRWLSAELRSADPQRWSAIHLRAARYWEAQGDIDRAVGHLGIAGEFTTLEEMVVVHGGRYFTSGLDATVERWLEAFPSEQARSSPGLNGLRCIQALHRGDELRAVQWMRLLDDAIRDAGGPSDDPTTWWGDILHAALDERRASELIPAVESAHESLGSGPWAGFAYWVHGALSFLDGDPEVARSALETGVFEAELAGTPLVVGQCLASLAVICECAGDGVESARHGRRAAELIASCGAELLPTTAPSMAMTALRCARGGQREEAVRGVVAARRALPVCGRSLHGST